MNEWPIIKVRKRRHQDKRKRITISQQAEEKLRQLRACKEIVPNNEMRTRTHDRDKNAADNIAYLALCKLQNVNVNENFRTTQPKATKKRDPPLKSEASGSRKRRK